MAQALPPQFLESPTLRFLNLVGRLRTGAMLESAQQELAGIIAEVTNPQLPESARTAAACQRCRSA